MHTITIQIKHDAVLRLIEDLARLNLVRVISRGIKGKDKQPLSARLAGSISDAQAVEMDMELNETRSEWGRDF